ncbi:MAG: 6-phosphofructokinase, partial [Candidatus Cloacimonetes bacterium]|nr:6-phosphofructokinase [Candidatus Cloacimonadota bacterium]
MKLEGKVVIAQGGGPTAVINQSLVGAALESRKFAQVTRVYGALYGVQGIVDEDFVDLTQETTHNLEQVADTPSSALMSTRDKPDEAYCKEIFKVLKAHDVRYFFYIGGNDSADTVRIVNEQANLADYEFRAIHIPKTIDNDLVLNDHTPGFGSAARFVASAFTGINLDNRALPGVYIGVVMGRHAGFLTAAAALAQKYPDDGPHLIYMPERAFSTDQFLKDVKKAYDTYGKCIIAVSEGIVDDKGVPIMTKLNTSGEKDAHGNVQLSGTGMLGDLLSDLVRTKLKIKRVRSDTFGYLQRSFMGCVSDVDQREAREVGERAAHYAIWYNLDGSISIQRTGFYSVNYQLEKLTDIAGKTKHMPSE